jgi:hypothetical protein
LAHRRQQSFKGAHIRLRARSLNILRRSPKHESLAGILIVMFRAGGDDGNGHSGLCPMQRRCFVQSDVVALVTLDFILRLVLAGVMSVTFVGNVLGMFLNDRSADMPGLGVPRYVITDLQVLWHGGPTPVANPS